MLHCHGAIRGSAPHQASQSIICCRPAERVIGLTNVTTAVAKEVARGIAEATAERMAWLAEQVRGCWQLAQVLIMSATV